MGRRRVPRRHRRVLGVLYFVQRSLLFPAPRATLAELGSRAELVRIPMFNTEAVALFLAPRPAAGKAPLMLFTHGNGELANQWLPELRADARARRRGAAGRISGLRPRAGFAIREGHYRSGAGRVRMGRRRSARHPSRIIAYGRSLGGTVAARLAADRRVAALILE